MNELSDEALRELTRPERLGPALAAATGDDRWVEHHACLIAGGRSNLTFEVTSEAGSLILRRPPIGALLPKAHDMVREARAQRALGKSGVPVPRIVLTDGAGEVLGVPCYVMERVLGHVIRDRLPDGYATNAAERTAITDVLVDTLALLHTVDPAAVGLGDFGRPGGFLARQVRLWAGQWERSADREVPEVTRLAMLLRQLLPASQRSSVVHGDFRLDNCVMDPVRPGRVAAVLDWEMATLGDPMTDLGMMLFYWREPGDPEIGLVSSVTGEGGFPSRRYLAERYSDATGAPLAEIGYYLAFAHFKFAVIVAGIAARVAVGAMAGQDFGDLTPLVIDCARRGLEILEEG